MTATELGWGRASAGSLVLAMTIWSVSAAAGSTKTEDSPERAPQPTAKLIVLKYRDTNSLRDVLNLLPAHIATDAQTNRLLVLGSADEIKQVEDVVRELDVPIERTPARRDSEASAPPELNLKVYRLRHRQPQEIRECVMPMMSDRGRISADPGSRTLLVKDEPAVHTDLALIIRELDVDLAVTVPQPEAVSAGSGATRRVSETRSFNEEKKLAPVHAPNPASTTTAAQPNVKMQIKICEINRAAIASLPPDDPAVSENPLVAELARGGNLCSVAEPFDHLAWLRAMTERDALRVVAEPTLVVRSGYSARFLKQVGNYAAPLVIEDDTGMDAVTQVVGLGVDLKFVPTVAGQDRIRLQAVAAFEPQQDGGVAELDAREPFVSVDVRAGQLFAMSGTVSARMEATRATGVGKVPLLGQLIRGSRATPTKTDLLVLVIPEVVHLREPADIALEPRERRE